MQDNTQENDVGTSLAKYDLLGLADTQFQVMQPFLKCLAAQCLNSMFTNIQPVYPSLWTNQPSGRQRKETLTTAEVNDSIAGLYSSLYKDRLRVLPFLSFGIIRGAVMGSGI